MDRITIRIRIRIRVRTRRGLLARVLDRLPRDRRDDKRDERRAPEPQKRPVAPPDRSTDDRRDGFHDRRDLRDEQARSRQEDSRGRDDPLRDIHERHDDDRVFGQREDHGDRAATDEYWERQGSGHPCPLCAGALGERWEFDPGDIKLHANCRCVKVHFRNRDRVDVTDPVEGILRGGHGVL